MQVDAGATLVLTDLEEIRNKFNELKNEKKILQKALNNIETAIEDQERKDFEATVKAYEAETKRIAAVQAGMTEQQIQDIAMGVVAAAMEQGGIPEMREPQEMPQMEQQGMEQMQPQGMPNEMQ